MRDASKRLGDILLAVSWGDVAGTYFGERPIWLHEKISGRSRSGLPAGLTREEAGRLREALLDLSRRISLAADRLQD